MKRRFSKVLRVLMVLTLSMSMFSCGKKESTVTPLEGEIRETYRTVSIATINGTATVTRGDGEKVTAYEGMSLYDGDDIVVDKDSSIIIDADSDKHLLAEAGTHFWLTIEGTEEQSNTKINLDTGAVLCQIEEKLEDGESFDVVTASSTMCVRGTVFRVNTQESEDSKFDVVEVYNGKVWSNINDSEDEVTLEPGQCAMVQTVAPVNGETVTPKYVTADQLDDDAWNNGEIGKSVKGDSDGEGSPILPIAYGALPDEVVDQLMSISEGGQEISINQDDLKSVKENTYIPESFKVSEDDKKVQYKNSYYDKETHVYHADANASDEEKREGLKNALEEAEKERQKDCSWIFEHYNFWDQEYIDCQNKHNVTYSSDSDKISHEGSEKDSENDDSSSDDENANAVDSGNLSAIPAE